MCVIYGNVYVNIRIYVDQRTLGICYPFALLFDLFIFHPRKWHMKQHCPYSRCALFQKGMQKYANHRRLSLRCKHCYCGLHSPLPMNDREGQGHSLWSKALQDGQSQEETSSGTFPLPLPLMPTLPSGYG